MGSPFQGRVDKGFCTTEIHHPNTSCSLLLCKRSWNGLFPKLIFSCSRETQGSVRRPEPQLSCIEYTWKNHLKKGDVVQSKPRHIKVGVRLTRHPEGGGEEQVVPVSDHPVDSCSPGKPSSSRISKLSGWTVMHVAAKGPVPCAVKEGLCREPQNKRDVHAGLCSEDRRLKFLVTFPLGSQKRRHYTVPPNALIFAIFYLMYCSFLSL